MRILLPTIFLALAGCAPDRVPPHTLLYTGDQQTRIWSYEPVVGEGHIARQLEPGRPITLDGGAVVSMEGGRVLINGIVIHTHNAVVDHDGRVRENAYIRTFR